MTRQQDNLRVEGEFYGRRRDETRRVAAVGGAAQQQQQSAHTRSVVRGGQTRFVDSSIVLGDDRVDAAASSSTARHHMTRVEQQAKAQVASSATNAHARWVQFKRPSQGPKGDTTVDIRQHTIFTKIMLLSFK